MARSRKKIRYAMVGLGHITQAAALPGALNTKNSEVVALVSDSPDKLDELSRHYNIGQTYSYEQYDDCLQSGDIDAVYIGLPNNLHCEYAVRAARAGVHVLCEKPMAVTEAECRQMIDAAEERGVKLMIAYRLHFDKANLSAIEVVQSGEIGEVRTFDAVFTQQVRSDNIRVERELGGSPLSDVGVYCLNAARYLFRAEPTEVFGWNASSDDERFTEVEEMTAAILRFPGERLATFTCSFGAADVSQYRLMGTKGDLRAEPAFGYTNALEHFITVDGKTRHRKFRKRDQFGAEIQYFSQCILDDTEPEPSGYEGLADVRVINALQRSAANGRPERLGEFRRDKRPNLEQEVYRPPIAEPTLVEVQSPSS